MTTDKEELRKEISKSIGTFENNMVYNISKSVTDLVYSKLEAKDKEIVELIDSKESFIESIKAAIENVISLQEQEEREEFNSGKEEAFNYAIEILDKHFNAHYIVLADSNKLPIKSEQEQITDLKAEIERMKGELPSVDEAGPIAVAICEDVKPELSVTEQSIFIAGFQECIKYLNS